MELGDVKSYFAPFHQAITPNEGSFWVTGQTGRNVRLKGFWYTCVGAKRGKVVFTNGGDTILEFVVIGNLASGSGIVTIPGNGIAAPFGLFCTVTDDEDSGGGLRSITVFYQA